MSLAPATTLLECATATHEGTPRVEHMISNIISNKNKIISDESNTLNTVETGIRMVTMQLSDGGSGIALSDGLGKLETKLVGAKFEHSVDSQPKSRLWHSEEKTYIASELSQLGIVEKTQLMNSIGRIARAKYNSRYQVVMHGRRSNFNAAKACSPTPKEVSRIMGSHTANTNFRAVRSNALAELSPQEMTHLFYIDLWGNVVSPQAEQGSICALGDNLLFSWYQRGGAVRETYVEWQPKANQLEEHADKPVVVVPSEAMHPLGITEDQVMSLIKYAKSSCGGNKRLWHYERMQILNWLTSKVNKDVLLATETSGIGIRVNFQDLIARSHDGKYIYESLSKLFESTCSF